MTDAEILPLPTRPLFQLWKHQQTLGSALHTRSRMHVTPCARLGPALGNHLISLIRMPFTCTVLSSTPEQSMRLSPRLCIPARGALRPTSFCFTSKFVYLFVMKS